MKKPKPKPRGRNGGRPVGSTQRAPMPGTQRARILALHRHGLSRKTILDRMRTEGWKRISESAISHCLKRWAA